MNHLKEAIAGPLIAILEFTLIPGWNLIGYSSDTALALSGAKFNNGTDYTWANAIGANGIKAYLSYYDSSSTTASLRKYKYLGTSGVDASSFAQQKGYWIYANSTGNLTLPAVGGSTNGQTYNWADLRFRNGSGTELNITEAVNSNWWSSYIKYWDTDNDGYRYVCKATGLGGGFASCLTT